MHNEDKKEILKKSIDSVFEKTINIVQSPHLYIGSLCADLATFICLLFNCILI